MTFISCIFGALAIIDGYFVFTAAPTVQIGYAVAAAGFAIASSIILAFGRHR